MYTWCILSINRSARVCTHRLRRNAQEEHKSGTVCRNATFFREHCWCSSIYKTIPDCQSYTYTPKQLRPKNLVLKGIYGGYDENDVKVALLAQNFEQATITKLLLHSTSYQQQPNRAIQGGGTAIIIKRDLNSEKIHFPSSAANSILEFTLVKFQLKNNSKLYIISAYATNDNKRLFLDELNTLLDGIGATDPKNYYVIAGDLNIRNKDWGDEKNNQRGLIFKKWIEQDSINYKATIYPPAYPTFKQSNSYLDISIADSRINVSTIKNNKLKCLEYDSDHNAISMEISIEADSLDNLINETSQHRHRFKSTKWKKFTKDLEKPAIKTLKDEIHKEFVKSATSYWTGLLKQIDHHPKKKISIADIKLKPNDSLIVNHKCITNRASLKNNQLTISGPVDKLDIIGNHFERINSPRYLNDGTATREIYNFSKWLIFMILESITEKSFITWDGTNISISTRHTQLTHLLHNPDSENNFNIKPDCWKFANHQKPFADDAIIYLSGTSVPTLQKKLQTAADDLIFNYSLKWNLRVNPITVPRKTTVRYLGVHLDYTLKNKDHLDTQLKAASNAFKSNSRIFYSKYLSVKAKIICYQLLVRPILTYAAPIWWNSNPTTMEKLRAFERRCLRACTGLYRASKSNYQKFVSNEKLYEAADIPRIDNFIIKLVRDYFAKLPEINNEIINNLAKIKEDQIEHGN
ncbi:Protein of unknown function, partial [Cotesia congregata]